MSQVEKRYFNRSGKITDVRFQQGVKAVHLKEVHPGSYWFTFDEYCVTQPETNSFTVRNEVDSDSEDDFHISLIHESAHCYIDEFVNPNLYPDTGRLYTLAKMCSGVAYDLINSGPRHLVMARSIQREIIGLDQSTNWYNPPRDKVFIEDAFLRSAQDIARLRSRAELRAYFGRQAKMITKVIGRYHAISEVQAWTQTVLTLLKFKQMGVSLFSKTPGELRAVVEGSLSGYQDYHDSHSRFPQRIAIRGSGRHPTDKALRMYSKYHLNAD